MEWDLEKNVFTGSISIFSHKGRKRKRGRERYISDSSKKGKGGQEMNARMKQYSLFKVVPR